jgi:release factor glutamine methyltransferase
LYSHPEDQLSELAWIHYGRYLSERLQGKPTQYITKRQEFYGREFLVTPDVLIPRPETEHVIEAALRLAGGARRLVDVGCGSGAIAVTLALELKAKVWATDISTAAIAVARENAVRLRANVRFVACDALSALAPGSVDLVVSNPPYVALGEAEGLQREVRDHEPRIALFAGETGLEVYQKLVLDGARVLAPGGRLIVELGYKSRDPVLALLGQHWRDIEVIPDLAGIPRVVAAGKP